MIKITIKKHNMVNNITSIIPQILSVDRNESYIPTHKNCVISYIRSICPTYTVLHLENEYKKLISKIHFQLNSRGYTTDSTGIDNFEIRILNICTTENITNLKKSEYCTAFIIDKLTSWIRYMKKNEPESPRKKIYSYKCESDNYKLFDIYKTITINNGTIFVEYTYVMLKQNIFKYFNTYLQSKNLILDNISQIYENLKKVYDIVWTDDLYTISCVFDSIEQMQNFDKILSEQFEEYLIQSQNRQDLIKSWFEHPFTICGQKNIQYNLCIYPEEDCYHLIIRDITNNENLSMENILSLCDNLNIEYCQKIIKKYFGCDDIGKIYLNSKFEYPILVDELSDITTNARYMLKELLN